MIKKILSALLSVAIIAGGVYAYASTRPDEPFYTVTADVEQAPNLFDGGRVMIRGVEVGEITDVRPRPSGVRVTMQIAEGIQIPTDAKLSVVPITVISDRYVQFAPAYTSGPTLEDGDHLALSQTSIPAELDDVLKQLKQLLATIEPKKGERGPLAKLIRDADYILKGNVDNVQGSLRNSASFLNNLAKSSEDINGLIRNLDELFITLAGRRSQIGLVNERFLLVARSLQADRKDLEGTIENVTLLSKEARKFFAQSGDDLGEALKNTESVIYELLEHQDSIAEGFRWTNVIAQALGSVDGSGKGLFAYTGKVAPSGKPGSEYNYRLDTRDTIACERMDALARRFQSLFPNWGVEEVRRGILEFLPEVYHEDLVYIIDQLLPYCTGLPFEGSMSSRAKAAVEKAVRGAGEEQFREAVGIWVLETIADADDARQRAKEAKKSP